MISEKTNILNRIYDKYYIYNINKMEPLKREKIVKKMPSYHEKGSFNEIYMKGSRPLPVYFKHATKVLNKHEVLIIHGLTAVITKVVELSLKLM